ncbi:MAG TPA: hypothetical protein VGJ86_09155 [Acidimicrobiales bacterium]|jgi:hypothetical protein
MARTNLIRWGTVAGGSAVLFLACAAPAAARPLDPPGNNGTVKIDGVDFDDHPDNEPHVGCIFQVDFYGYDEGDLQATVTFDPVAPTDGDELTAADVFIGEDAASGGTDLDASVTYDLTEPLSAIEPHPQQGWHVKLTIHAEGSQGADVKHKVFWVSGCGETPPSTTSTSTTSTVPGSTTTTEHGNGNGHGSTTTTEHGGGGPSSSTPPTSEMGSAAPGPTVPTTAAVQQALAQTGSNSTLPLVGAALGLLTVGGGVALFARRLRAAGL